MNIRIQDIMGSIYIEPLVFNTVVGHVWILLSTETTLMMV